MNRRTKTDEHTERQKLYTPRHNSYARGIMTMSSHYMCFCAQIIEILSGAMLLFEIIFLTIYKLFSLINQEFTFFGFETITTSDYIP